MITRRDFGAGILGVGALGTAVRQVAASPHKPQKNRLMHVGGDYHSVLGDGITSKQNLEYNLRHGVRHLTAELKNRPGEGWDVDQLKRMRDDCNKNNVVLEAIRMNSDYMQLPKGMERDREIEIIAGNIRKSVDIGVKIITYHWELIPFRRNAKTLGRGGVTYDCFKLEDDWKSLPMGTVSRVTQEQYWERITHFLERIIPVAKESDVLNGVSSLRPAWSSRRLSGRRPMGFARYFRSSQALRVHCRHAVQRLSTGSRNSGGGSEEPGSRHIPHRRVFRPAKKNSPDTHEGNPRRIVQLLRGIPR